MKRLISVLGILCLFLGAYGQAPNITAVEYYIDSDPGHGSGEPVSFSSGASVDFNLSVPTTSLSSGFHVLAIRAMDENGVWSHPELRPFFISKSTSQIRTDISAVEYFLDLDPGQGNGVSISITPGTDIELIEQIPTTSLSPGFHVVHFRVQDASGQWSPAEHKSFFISQSTTEVRNDITAVEYFLEVDPGQGNGVSISITPGTDIELIEQIPTTSLSPGFHVVHFRVQDASGQWSPAEHKSFFISQSTTEVRNDITAVEYFLNVDPGQGNGVSVAITPGSDVELIEQIPTTSLSPGFHTVYFRVQDASGQWSPAEQEPFFISKSTSESRTDITAVEYFLDVDPGQGNGVDVAITPATDIELIEQIPTTSLSPGFHTVSFRVQDASGQWSPAEQKPFFISKSTSEIQNNISGVEYFFDIDPGQGNGQSVAITPTSNLDLVHQVDVSSLNAGFHVIFFRVQDDAGVWSLPENQPFFITVSSKEIRTVITAIEYFFDGNDPGFGGGQSLSISSGMDVDEAVSISTNALSFGMHTIHIRTMDDQGQWSHKESKPFFVDPTRVVTTIEYAIDIDPGEELATQISVVPPERTIDNIIEVSTNSLSVGSHDLFIRVKDGDGVWGITETSSFEVIAHSLNLDSIALDTLYRKTIGADWVNSTNWYNVDLDTWFGVDTLNNRVEDVLLPSNNLIGILPPEIGYLNAAKTINLSNNQLQGIVPDMVLDLGALIIFDISENEFTHLPDLTLLGQLAALDVSNNLLTFEDIEPNVGIAGIVYSPQKQIAGPGMISLDQGDPLNLIIPVGGSSNQYQWVKDDVDLVGETFDNLSISNVVPTDAGTYYLRIISPLVPGLILRSEDIVVSIGSPEINVYNGNDNTGIVVLDEQAAIIDLGMAIQSNSITHTFAIENTGNQTLNISDIIVSGIDYTVISAISFIAPGTADTFTITLSGSAIGTFNSTITIVSDDADENPFTFDVSGTITAPEINVFVGLDNTGTVVTNGQTTVVDLGSAVEGNNIIQTIAIENTGTSDLAIGSITSSATEYTVGGIPTTVAAGSTQTFTITLNGTTPGIFNTTITIVNDDADENPFTFDINGSITTPEISIFLGADNSGVAITAGQTGSIDYGSAIVGNDIVQSFAIENTGTSILNITNITSSSADFTVTSSITSIATGITETFEVTLSGANVGTFNTTITVESDDTDEALFDFSVIGTIEPPPAPEINVFLGSGNTAPAINDAQPEPINVGTGMLENDFTQTFAIENTGTFVLNVSSISITGTDYTVNSSISAIAVGTTETFDVILSAATPGIFDAIVTITSNDLDEGEFTFSITGTILGMNIIEGEVPSGNVLISNQQVNLGSTPLSVNIEKAFVIQNLSTSNELEINGIESDNPVFEVENKNTKVATSEFVQFMVTLVALTPGTYQANISVSTSVNDFVFIVTGEVLEGVLPELNVFNAVTPNGDSVHDFLKIGNIDFYPDNTLVIYNRWGDKVFETTGYDNVNNTFIGNANVGSADELETGNYFYRIDKGGDYGKISGYLFLKR